MKNELDSRRILAVFEKVRAHGEKTEKGHRLQGITVYTDHDGYTLFLEDALVSLSVGFHNQYHFKYDKTDHYEQFVKKLDAIAKTS